MRKMLELHYAFVQLYEKIYITYVYRRGNTLRTFNINFVWVNI